MISTFNGDNFSKHPFSGCSLYWLRSAFCEAGN